MREVLHELNEWTREGEEIAIATVIETWGSSPRPLGSKMLVTRSGKMAGSVSNGCIEGAVFEEAQKVLKTRKPKVAAFGVADDVAFDGLVRQNNHRRRIQAEPSFQVRKGKFENTERRQRPIASRIRRNRGDSAEANAVEGAVHEGSINRLFVRTVRAGDRF